MPARPGETRRRLGRGLEIVGRRSGGGQHGQRIGLGVVQIGLARGSRQSRGPKIAGAQPGATSACPSGRSSR